MLTLFFSLLNLCYEAIYEGLKDFIFKCTMLVRLDIEPLYVCNKC